MTEVISSGGSWSNKQSDKSRMLFSEMMPSSAGGHYFSMPSKTITGDPGSVYKSATILSSDKQDTPM